jgi:hypothetical protein
VISKLVFIVPMLAAIWTVAVHGEVTLEKYHAVKETQGFKQYLDGVGTGFFWANTHQDTRNLARLYCQPGKLPLYAENYVQILEDYIYSMADKSNPLPDGIPVELLLLNALKETFPCK